MSSINTGGQSNSFVPGNAANHRYLDMMTVRPSQGARLTTAANLTAFNPATAMIPLPTTPGIMSKQQSFSSSSSALNSPNNNNTNNFVNKGFPPLGDKISAMPSTYITAQTHQLQGGALVRQSPTTHNKLLIEPILLPNLQHVHVDNPQDLEESCLFYPNGHKNKNIRREIESNVVKHHIIENNRMKIPEKKNKYRVIPKDIYADVKGPPLYYTKPKDKETEDLLKTVRNKEHKIISTVQVRI